MATCSCGERVHQNGLHLQGAVITGGVASGLGFSLRDRGNESSGPEALLPALAWGGGGGWGVCAAAREESSVGAGCWAARIITARISGNGPEPLPRPPEEGPGRQPSRSTASSCTHQSASRHRRYRSLPPRHPRLPGPAEIGSEGEQLPSGFASKIKQEEALSSRH